MPGEMRIISFIDSRLAPKVAKKLQSLRASYRNRGVDVQPFPEATAKLTSCIGIEYRRPAMDIAGWHSLGGFASGLAGSHAADAARFQRSTSSSKKNFYHSRVSQGAAAAFADASAERSD